MKLNIMIPIITGLQYDRAEYSYSRNASCVIYKSLIVGLEIPKASSRGNGPREICSEEISRVSVLVSAQRKT